MTLEISPLISIPLDDIELRAIRASGPGGQHVNKVATAIQLRFDIANCPQLPEDVRQRVLRCGDSRITDDGWIRIKAQRHRSRERNREDALNRLRELITEHLQAPTQRRKTRPSKNQKEKRLQDKNKRSQVKQLRSRPGD